MNRSRAAKDHGEPALASAAPRIRNGDVTGPPPCSGVIGRAALASSIPSVAGEILLGFSALGDFAALSNQLYFPYFIS